MSNHPRRVLTPGGPSKKRKDRDGFDAPMAFKTTKAEPMLPNRLLAGYLAHEFLTQGTLFGEKYDPARAEAATAVINHNPKADGTSLPKPKAYDDVANLLKTDGAHIPGIVNPTQLARWLQM